MIAVKKLTLSKTNPGSAGLNQNFPTITHSRSLAMPTDRTLPPALIAQNRAIKMSYLA